jgi:pantoate--beta-alanine ligase
VAELVREIGAVRQWLGRRRLGQKVGFVPTMGALHAGHRRLLETARAENDLVAASIFVNPTQFDRPEDLNQYPQSLEHDTAVCSAAGVDVVFAPGAAEMYPRAQLTWVEVPALTRTLCGAGRPGHFRGVTTVVTKLFQIVQPDRAYFGEKDAQQLAIIRRMVADLNIPVSIVPVATVREPDGLAMSSRNQRLSPAERQRATALSRALFKAQEMVEEGERSPEVIAAWAAAFLTDVQLEYFSIVYPETLAPVERIEGPVLIAGAIWLGSTRLIDNVTAAPAITMSLPIKQL